MRPRSSGPGEGGRPRAASPWTVQAFHADEREPSITPGSVRGLKSAGYTTTPDMGARIIAERFLESEPDPGEYVLVAGPGPVGNVTVVKVRVFEQPRLVVEVL